MAAELEHVLCHREFAPFRNTDLFTNKVETGDHLCHGMFHLDAGVHFDEIEFAVFPKEFDRSCAAITHIGHRLGSHAAHPHPFFRTDNRGRSFFEHFLVAALERTIALTQMDRIAIAIAKNLELDMARIAEILFQIDRRIAECGFRFRSRLQHLGFEFAFRIDDLHAPSATARSGFDDDGIAYILGDLLRFANIFNRAFGARNQRHA